MSRAQLVIQSKHVDDELITEIRVWKLPAPTIDRPHGFKYSLHCCRLDGALVVRFDNETGKGDHFHNADGEHPYRFTTLAKLMVDFRDSIRRQAV